MGAVALAVVAIVVINGFRLVATESFVRAEYRLRTQPPDVELSQSDRRALALLGLASIRPRTQGGELLRRAKLPGGSPAFNERELAHMHDVRVLFRRTLRLQTLLAVVLLGAAIGLRRTRGREIVPTGLLAGGVLTLGGALALVPFVLLGFNGVFERFHGIFFEGDTWRFAATDTLLRIYPERFWEDTSVVIAGLVVAQAALVALVGWYWRRRARA